MIDRPATLEQFCNAVIAGDVSWNRDRIQLLGRLVEPLDIARRKDDFGTFPLRHLGGRKTNAGGTTDDDDFLACKQH